MQCTIRLDDILTDYTFTDSSPYLQADSHDLGNIDCLFRFKHEVICSFFSPAETEENWVSKLDKNWWLRSICPATLGLSCCLIVCQTPYQIGLLGRRH